STHAETIIAIAAGGHAGVPHASARRHGDDRVLRPGGKYVGYPDYWSDFGANHDDNPHRPTSGRASLYSKPDHAWVGFRVRPDHRDGHPAYRERVLGRPGRTEPDVRVRVQRRVRTDPERHDLPLRDMGGHPDGQPFHVPDGVGHERDALGEERLHRHVAGSSV